MKWFGPEPFSTACIGIEQVPAPVHTSCLWCEEPIEAEDYGFVRGEIAEHQECVLRQVVGSVGHLLGSCLCYVTGSSEGDPPGMTKREAARAAVAMYRKNRPQ